MTHWPVGREAADHDESNAHDGQTAHGRRVEGTATKRSGRRDKCSWGTMNRPAISGRRLAGQLGVFRAQRHFLNVLGGGLWQRFHVAVLRLFIQLPILFDEHDDVFLP